MKVLMIGGTGLISTAVTKRAVDMGHDVYLLNRGLRAKDMMEGVHHIQADITQLNAVKQALKGYHFDTVVDWIAFHVGHIKRDIELFQGLTDQYIFIGTASSYPKPSPFLPITEDIPLSNPFWGYSEEKRKCEEYLNAILKPPFGITIVRPSHTYDDHSLVFQIPHWGAPFTLLSRMIHGDPIVIAGDGSSLWTLTHHTDFACAFVDLFGQKKTYGETYHLTSDKVYSWQKITESLYQALGKKPNIIHMPYDMIYKHFPDLEGPMRGDNLYDAIFDNSKIKQVAPHYQSTIEYPDVAKKVVQYFLSHPDVQSVDDGFMKRYNSMIEDYLKS
jgi:nucleoside-diphosphate-sugar epimerase